MVRQLDITRKVSLAGLSDIWGPECYALMRPMDYPEVEEVERVTGETPDESKLRTWQLNFVKKHFVSGKVRYNGEVVDMEPEDIEGSPDLCDKLFLGIYGSGELDPKDIRAAAALAQTQRLSATSTETSSLEG